VIAEASLSIPVAVMTYVNPVYRRGFEEFLLGSEKAGVAAIIVPDLPVDEADELARVFPAPSADKTLAMASWSTCQAAFRRSSVEECISMFSSLSSRVVSVPLKSNRCEISREAWSTALRTSWRSTSETMSKLN